MKQIAKFLTKPLISPMAMFIAPIFVAMVRDGYWGLALAFLVPAVVLHSIVGLYSEQS